MRSNTLSDSPALHVIAIARDPATVRLLEKVLAGSEDRLSIASDLAEGLARAASEAPDLVLVEVAMSNNAGLAVVHHLRALAPQVAIYALASPAHLELGSQAVALGGTGVLMLPLVGDELLGAMSSVRARMAEQRLREELEREVRSARLTGDLLEALDAIGTCPSRRQAAAKTLGVFLEATRARRGAVFLRASDASRDLMLVERVGEVTDLPGFCSEMELMRHAASRPGFELIRLAGRTSQQGVLLLCEPEEMSAAVRAALERAAAHAAAVVALGAERETASLGTMKDPESSAYTFAYFVDVAGREIDKARRHGRRFAVATLTIGPGDATGDPQLPSVQMAEHVLGAVRDTDILARVDDREFYLLLPETGGIGAHACRRRIMRHFRKAPPGASLAIGVATYPHDGGDLSQLMRVARHRADASRDSVVFGEGFDALGLSEVLDTLLWNVKPAARPDAPRSIEIPRADLVRLAASAVSEARRSGSAWALTTERPGLSLSSAVRSALGPTSDNVRLECTEAALLDPSGELEAFSLITEHGAYSLLGRAEGNLVRAVHTADPLFSDFVVDRLSEAAGSRFWSS